MQRKTAAHQVDAIPKDKLQLSLRGTKFGIPDYHPTEMVLSGPLLCIQVTVTFKEKSWVLTFKEDGRLQLTAVLHSVKGVEKPPAGKKSGYRWKQNDTENIFLHDRALRGSSAWTR